MTRLVGIMNTRWRGKKSLALFEGHVTGKSTQHYQTFSVLTVRKRVAFSQWITRTRTWVKALLIRGLNNRRPYYENECRKIMRDHVIVCRILWLSTTGTMCAALIQTNNVIIDEMSRPILTLSALFPSAKRFKNAVFDLAIEIWADLKCYYTKNVSFFVLIHRVMEPRSFT